MLKKSEKSVESVVKKMRYEDKHTCMDGSGDVGSNHNKSPKANLGDFCIYKTTIQHLTIQH
jgi:hypothetical protein